MHRHPPTPVSRGTCEIQTRSFNFPGFHFPAARLTPLSVLLIFHPPPSSKRAERKIEAGGPCAPFHASPFTATTALIFSPRHNSFRKVENLRSRKEALIAPRFVIRIEKQRFGKFESFNDWFFVKYAKREKDIYYPRFDVLTISIIQLSNLTSVFHKLNYMYDYSRFSISKNCISNSKCSRRKLILKFAKIMKQHSFLQSGVKWRFSIFKNCISNSKCSRRNLIFKFAKKGQAWSNIPSYKVECKTKILNFQKLYLQFKMFKKKAHS